MSDIIFSTSDLFSPACNILENKSLQKYFKLEFVVGLQALAVLATKRISRRNGEVSA